MAYTRDAARLVIGDPTGGMANQSADVRRPVRRDAYSGRQRRGVQGEYCRPDCGLQQFRGRRNQGGYQARHQCSSTARRTNTTKTTTGPRIPGRTTRTIGGVTVGAQLGHIGLPSYHYSRFGGAIGGPLIPKEVLGGKTFFFFNYEGFRYPNSETITRNVPSPALRLGLLTDSTTGKIAYNLNNAPVTFNGTTYPGELWLCPRSRRPL